MSEPRKVSLRFVIVVVVLAVVLFFVPSAYAASRGAAWWLSLAIAVLAFPVLPVIWHLIGERRRKARVAAVKVPSRSKDVLTGGDRFVLRCIAVGVVAIAPIFALGGKGAVSAVWHNATWIVPPTPWPGHLDAPMLTHVPADAEIVVAFHKEGGLGNNKDKDKDDAAIDGVIAYGNRQALMIAEGPLDMKDDVEAKLKELNAERDKAPFAIDPISVVSSSSSSISVATDGWKKAVTDGGAGPNADIRRELARAPSDAVVAVAVVPKGTLALRVVKSAAAWLLVDDDKLTIVTQIEAADAAAVKLAHEQIKSLWAKERKKVPEACQEPIDKIADKLHVDENGATVKLSIELPLSSIAEVFMCGLKG